jgi:Ca-activated chloride channel family protein
MWSARKELAALLFLLCVVVADYGQSTEPVETIRVDADLVDLRVRVVSLNAKSPAAMLQRNDFRVLENGEPQDISFFAAADTPFDLVLLLDLSGSSRDKLKLIRKSAKRFVEQTRSSDRVSVVAFSDRALLVCPMTDDRKRLKKAIDDMEEPNGGTRFWDSLHYVLAILNAAENSARRSAVVVMTDGVDNALPEVYGDGSRTPFERLLQIVRVSNALVFPIYVDTEMQEYKRHRTPHSAFATAREQLGQLASASGTTLYTARRLQDLDDVYQQVIGDLGRIYSIGYRPTQTVRDGKWRVVSVQIPTHNDVAARTKEGYYAPVQPD